jgi:transposase-like protein
MGCQSSDDQSGVAAELGADHAARRLLWLALRNHSKKWSFVQNWREALNRFQILWPERMPALERS